MPAKLPTHRPPRPADPGVKAREQARRDARFLPYRGKQWQAIRRAQLERFPLCEDCGGVASEVDHNTNDTSRNLIGVELSSLCKPCHSKRTNARMYGPKVQGCDVDGWPLDPAHPWNQGEKSLEGASKDTGRPVVYARPRIARLRSS